ncbi:uncharacterized protein LOC106385497 [Brassica napus]|uniref:uncharacterized protein LOC106385497 n=1 Tax=Brassica napus TaxID=3708 RepID=UPI0006AACC20|nr:uncharacterized protein LOC106385497 [Brassica napus]
MMVKPVHTAISDIALFFRDISAKILKIEDVARLKENIAIMLCNLEKIFPLAFFDVMEHLPVHLPDEALLGGPVQYRWMYPFERYMYHLKKKVKNKARIGGSIVAQCVNEEISYVTNNYIAPSTVQVPEKDVNEIRFTYKYLDVPIMFQQEGRISGKSSSAWLNDEDYNILQTFLLLNCEVFEPYERMFEDYMMDNHPNITSNDMTRAKDEKFAMWCKDYINNASKSFEFPLWMLEFVQGPKHQITSWPMYYSRGYHYHTQSHGQNKKKMNFGVCVPGTTETEYFGLIEEIFMIEYHGAVGLKAMIFKCHWFNIDQGIRRHPSGNVDVCPQMHYDKYDPFISPEQCDQVCYVPYTRLRSRREEWWTTIKVMPRGFFETKEVSQNAIQNNIVDHVISSTNIVRVEAHAVQDDSNYEPMPMINPEDEYLSENDFIDQYDEYSYSDSHSD